MSEAQQERDKIVAWLRWAADDVMKLPEARHRAFQLMPEAMKAAADSIEQGEHVEWTSLQTEGKP